MFSFCPYSWPQLLLRSIVLVQEHITRLAPAQGVPTPLFSSMFSLAFLVSFSRLVPRLTAPHVGFGLVPYVEHAHFHRLRRTCLLIFSISRSSPYFIVGYKYGPMDFQDSFEACVKKGVKPFVMSFCHSPCHASIQQDNNDI